MRRLEIEFDVVRVEYEGNDTRLEVSGEATWSEPSIDVDAGIRLDNCRLQIVSNTDTVSLVGTTGF